jgi:hypothetical protein
VNVPRICCSRLNPAANNLSRRVRCFRTHFEMI